MAIAIDPVCGMNVETEGATLTADHDGVTYYFCGRGCLLDFRDEPERYVHPAEAAASATDDERPAAR